MDPRPQKVPRQEPIGVAKIENIEEMLEDYRRHWKNVKKRFVFSVCVVKPKQVFEKFFNCEKFYLSWSQYNRKREQRYSNSIQLLRTVYGIAQQTQM